MLKPANKSYLMVLLLLVVSLSGCSHLGQRGGESQSTKIEGWFQSEVEQHKEAMKLLKRFRALDALSKKKLKAAYRSAERTFSKRPTVTAQLELAWLLAMKNTNFQNIPRALNLLEAKRINRTQQKLPEALNDLVYLMRRIVTEQQHQQDRYRRVVAALNKEQQTSRELATKIKDLTQIEESMIQRKPLLETELR